MILPAGFIATGAAVVSPATGWTATPNTSAGDVELRSTANAVAPGKSLIVNVRIDPNSITGCTKSAWSAVIKQSNDFNGTNNLFTMLTTGSELTPLGSFVFAPITSTAPGTDIQVPQILVNQTTNLSITALDTCGKADADYSGAKLAPSPADRLANATFGSLTWATNGTGDRLGSASLMPTDVEVQDTVVVTDPASQISQPSNQFDVVETICALTGTSCVWSNKKGTITATSTVGTSTTGETASLGL
ncbi:MAG TPA: hypothetical protein VF091_07615, partial [Gaiellaceae bacterium]